MKRLLDYDEETGLKTWHDYDPATKTTTIGYEQDVEPILERNKAIQREGADAKGMNAAFREGVKREWCWVASIPIGVQYHWLGRYGINIYDRNHWPKVRQLLNDPEWQYLRTGLGRI